MRAPRAIRKLLGIAAFAVRPATALSFFGPLRRSPPSLRVATRKLGIKGSMKAISLILTTIAAVGINRRRSKRPGSSAAAGSACALR